MNYPTTVFQLEIVYYLFHHWPIQLFYTKFLFDIFNSVRRTHRDYVGRPILGLDEYLLLVVVPLAPELRIIWRVQAGRTLCW